MVIVIERNALCEAFRRLEALLTDDTSQSENDCHPFVPLPADYFCVLLEKAIKIHSYLNPGQVPKFLDAGCGLGTKVLLAECMGCLAEGLEINQEYVTTAKKLVDPTKIFVGDVCTFDKYQHFDILYTFRPMKDNNKFFSKMFAEAKENAIILNVNEIIENIYPVTHGISIKISSPNKEEILQKLKNLVE